MKKLETEAAIIGGGMVGMSLAVALASEGVAVIVIDREDPGKALSAACDGRASAIAASSGEFFRKIGAWRHMEGAAQAIEDIRVSEMDVPVYIHFDHREVGAVFGHIIPNLALRKGLLARARELQSLTIIAPEKVEKIEMGREKATLRLGGAEISARLLIGADGKNSEVRAAAGIGVYSHDYKQDAIVCSIAHERPHYAIASERFIPTGPFAVLPLPGNFSSLVWVEPRGVAIAYMALPDAEFTAEIQKRAGKYLGEISLAGKRWVYPLKLAIAKKYIGPRMALVGDAAHSIHPLAGQGANLGFRDAELLAGMVAENKRLGLDIGGSAMLGAYEKRRKLDNVKMVAATHGLNLLFSNSLPPVKLARNAGLWAVNQMPPLKKFFMKSAMGK